MTEQPQQPQYPGPHQQWQAGSPAAPMQAGASTGEPLQKKRRKWPWILGGVIAIIIIGNLIGGGGDNDDPPAQAVTTSTAQTEEPTPEPTSEEPTPEPTSEEPTTEEPEPEPTTEEADEPELTVGQQNAVEQAENYLAFMAFSRTGLIEQLEYEGYSNDEAAFAVDHIDVDWNEQAAAKAQEYMDSMSFSRQGLIDQLIFEGFTQEQAEYGVDAAGY